MEVKFKLGKVMILWIQGIIDVKLNFLGMMEAKNLQYKNTVFF